MLKSKVLIFFNIFFLTNFIEISFASRIDDALCERQLNYFNNGLTRRDDWAIYVFDTWAKIQSSVLRGNRVITGGFSDCVAFRHESNDTQVGTFQGQHCMIRFRAKQNAGNIINNNEFDWREIGKLARERNYVFRHGYCVPASCSEQKSIEFMRSYLSNADLEPFSATCLTNDPIKFTPLDIFAIVLFSLIGLIVISSTLYEITKIKQNREPCKLLSSFSVYTSGSKLFDLTKSGNPNDIRCLHGIRALSIIYIIFGHRYGVSLFFNISNGSFLQEWSQLWYLGIYQTHQVAVDVFLLLGGTLVTWSVMRSLDKKQLNIWRIYLHRFLRYTPLLAVVLLFFITLFKHLILAPLNPLYTGQSLLLYAPDCEKWWWTTLLHVQNYVNPNEICMSHSWYLSVDFQLFIISPLLIIPAKKYGWKFAWILPMLTLLSSIYIFVVSMVYRVWIVTKTDDAASYPFFIKWIYYPTHARCGPWFIGMMLGYILYQNRNKKVKVNFYLNSALWIISISILMAITMGSQILFLPPDVNPTSLFANASYLALYRNGFALANAWIIFAIQNGTGGLIRWFLQLPQWQVIGRMGLSLYLISYIFQNFTVMSLKHPIYFDEFELVHKFFGDFGMSFLIAITGYLVFELPFLSIESFLYDKYQSNKKINQ